MFVFRTLLRKSTEKLPPPRLSLLEELDWFFCADGPFSQCTFDFLETLATKVQQQCLSRHAINLAKLDVESHPTGDFFNAPNASGAASYEMPDTLEGEVDEPAVQVDDVFDTDAPAPRNLAEDDDGLSEEVDDFDGDRVLWNTLVFMRDACWYLEMHQATEDGDPGRVFEIVKVCILCPIVQKRLKYSLRYSSFVLYLAEQDQPTTLVKSSTSPSTIFSTLPLTSKLPSSTTTSSTHLDFRGWHELDLLQEHMNFWIKAVFNGKSMDFDSAFLQEAVSLNVKSFGNLREGLSELFGICRTSYGRSEPSLVADLNTLGRHYLSEDILSFRSGRPHSFKVVDAYEDGYDNLHGPKGKLALFLQDIKAGTQHRRDG